MVKKQLSKFQLSTDPHDISVPIILSRNQGQGEPEHMHRPTKALATGSH